MTLVHETLATGVFVSFYVYDPKGVLLHTEQNEMYLDSYNKENKDRTISFIISFSDCSFSR